MGNGAQEQVREKISQLDRWCGLSRCPRTCSIEFWSHCPSGIAVRRACVVMSRNTSKTT